MPNPNNSADPNSIAIAEKAEWQKKVKEQSQCAAELIRRCEILADKTRLEKILEKAFESQDVWKRFSDLSDIRQRQLNEAFGPLTQDDPRSFFAECHADWLWANDEYDRNGLTEDPGEYVAIVNRTVLGAGDDDIELRRRVARTADVKPERVVIIHRGI